MNDTPYTTPDEDPFNVTPLLQQPRRRSSSLLDKWIREQQITPVPPETAASAVDTCLDCPTPNPTDDTSTVQSYDLVQDQDIPHNPGRPVTPTHTPSHASTLIRRTASFRNFNLPFHSNSSTLPATPLNDSPRSSSRLSFLTKTSRAATILTPISGRTSPGPQHSRSPSVSTVQGMPEHTSKRSSFFSTSSRWRPSVLGHFSTPSRSSEPAYSPRRDSPYTPPRPSISSADSCTTGLGAVENDLGNIFSKLSLGDSVRSRADVLKSRVASSSSLWSQSQTFQTSVSSPTDSPQSGSPQQSLWLRNPAPYRPYASVFDEELDEITEEVEQPISPSKPITKPQVAYSSGGSLSRVRFSALTKRHKRKRRLVVSGIKPNDVRKFESLKRWCESFGEVSQITRMPNNDLHVHFRHADVAETVCRLRAKVFINGVGSVQLSWTYGDK